jgi:hypothetical protein
MEYKNLEAELINIGKTITEEYKTKLKKVAYASGKLYNSIDYKIEIKGDSVTLHFIAEDYYINVENGRRAGSKMPPIREIKKWMLSKGLPNIERGAFAIARSIAKRGIRPKPELREIRTSISDYSKELAEALELDIKEQLNNK